MFTLPLRVLVSMAIPVFAGLLASCVSLEFDRMTGTTFPPQHMVNGQPVTVSSIFDDAGIKLTVEQDDTGIQPLNIAQDECISDAELSTLENGHRHLSLFPTAACPFDFCNTYHLYGAVVNHYGEVLDVCIPEFIWARCGRGTRGRPSPFFIA